MFEGIGATPGDHGSLLLFNSKLQQSTFGKNTPQAEDGLVSEGVQSTSTPTAPKSGDGNTFLKVGVS